MGVLLGIIHFDHSVQCELFLWGFIIGYLIVLGLSLATEVWICVVAMRGSILDTAPRSSMQYILYIRLGFKTQQNVMVFFDNLFYRNYAD